MGNIKKNTLQAVFLLAVFGFTLYMVFKGEDLNKVVEAIKSASMGYILTGVICFCIFVCCESVIIFYMMRSLGSDIHLSHCILYSFVGFFFSAITPSATGGQPAQIYYMKKDGLDIPVSTLVLMIVTVTYKLVLVVIGLLVFLLCPDIVHLYIKGPFEWVFYLGFALNVFCVTFMMILIFHPDLAKKIIITGLNILERIHLVKKRQKYEARLVEAMDKYHKAARFYRENKMIVINVFLITLSQRLLLFFVTYLVYRSFGLSGTSVFTIVILQGLISMAVDMLPLPGGMGISEKLYLEIFRPVFGGRLLLPSMVLSRGLAYYSQIVFGAVLTIVAQFTIGRNKKNARGRKENAL